MMPDLSGLSFAEQVTRSGNAASINAFEALAQF